MYQDLLSQVSFIVDMTGSYTHLIITSMSNQMLVFGFMGLIILVFAKYYFRMLKDTSNSLNTLKQLQAILEKATGKKDIKTATDRTEAQKMLRKMKNEASFISSVEKANMINWWEQINQNFTYEVGGDKIYTTTDFINSFLNFDNFITSSTSRGVLSAPSVLTGLGIIGTFLGLTIGVGSASAGLASPDISIARNAMSQLLEGAQLAFLTSLAGLSFALFMRLSFTSKSEKIRLKIEKFNKLLSTVAIPKDSGISGLAALNKIQENTQDLSNVEIVSALKNIMSNTQNHSAGDSQLSSLDKKLEQLSKDLQKLGELKNEG